MGRTKPKTIAPWMKKFWMYDIGSGDNCTMGCKCCKHKKLWEFCTKVKKRFGIFLKQNFGRPSRKIIVLRRSGFPGPPLNN